MLQPSDLGDFVGDSFLEFPQFTEFTPITSLFVRLGFMSKWKEGRTRTKVCRRKLMLEKDWFEAVKDSDCDIHNVCFF